MKKNFLILLLALLIGFSGQVGAQIDRIITELSLDTSPMLGGPLVSNSFSIRITNATEGNVASLNIKTSHETHTLAAANTSDTTAISIPSGAKLIGVSFNVNTTVVDDAGNDTWGAAYVTGSSTTLATAVAAAQDTKVDTLHVDEISTGVVQIRFTANGGNFSAGVIEVVAYYMDLTSLDDT